MASLPSASSPVLEGDGFSAPWYRFFSDLVGKPGAIEAIPLGASPFSYTAPAAGHLVISGGSVSQLRILRGRVSFTYPLGSHVPVSAGDIVIVTYGTAPALTFIPA
jgi:hypothetical protein